MLIIIIIPVHLQSLLKTNNTNRLNYLKWIILYWKIVGISL